MQDFEDLIFSLLLPVLEVFVLNVQEALLWCGAVRKYKPFLFSWLEKVKALCPAYS